MASDVMTNEEFIKHIKRMVTWMEATEADGVRMVNDRITAENFHKLHLKCPHCGGVLPDEGN